MRSATLARCATGHDRPESAVTITGIRNTEWSGVSVKEHKAVKGLGSHNLRDHMTEAELIFTALAELSTRQIAETMEATGLPENTTAAKAGGGIAKQARKQLESQTGKSVVSGQNYLPPKPPRTLKAAPKK